MKEDIEKLEEQLNFDEQVNALKNRLENHIVDACYRFIEEWRNWDHFQEEFPDEHSIDVFLDEVVNEVLQDMGETGIVL